VAAGDGAAAVTSAKSLLAASLVAVLQTLERQLDEYRRRINAAFAEHPDHDIFGSLPGAGEKLAPRLLSGLGAVREVYPDADALSCQAGASPVAYQSGRVNQARIRWACDVALRHTVHLWADQSRKQSAWAAAYYRRKREQGHGHASALRCLGKRWLKILWRLWQDRQTYDEARHQQNQRKHGSWVSGLLGSQNHPGLRVNNFYEKALSNTENISARRSPTGTGVVVGVCRPGALRTAPPYLSHQASLLLPRNETFCWRVRASSGPARQCPARPQDRFRALVPAR